jgi:ADP-ribose pyrophosphatase
VFAEVIHLFLATGIAPAATAHEHAEVIEIHWLPFDTACEWALSGTITDSKTVIGLLRARLAITSTLAAE